MPWVKIDDQFQDHPKFLGLSMGAIGLWLSSLAYVSRYLSDGFVSDAARLRVGGRKSQVAELVAAGLWVELPEGGWAIHDYLDFNPSSEQVRELRDKRAEAGKRGGQARGQQKQTEAKARQLANQVADPLLSPRPVPSRPLTEVDLVKVSTSSSSTDDDDKQFASEALTAVGRRRHLRAVAAGKVNGNAGGHERSCVANALAELADDAHVWQADHPAGTVAQLVAYLDPDPAASNGSTRPAPCPECRGNHPGHFGPGCPGIESETP